MTPSMGGEAPGADVGSSPDVSREAAWVPLVWITVVDPAGEAIEGAQLHALADEVGGLPSDGEVDPRAELEARARLRRTVPAEGLRLEESKLAPGLLLVTAPGFQPAFRWVGVEGESVPSELRFVLAEEELLFGSVIDDLTGDPVPAATILAMPSRRPTVQHTRGLWRLDHLLLGGRAESDELGWFELDGLRDEALRLWCRHPDYADAVMDLFPDGQELTFRLSGASPIRGTVRDIEGQPVAKAEVQVQTRGPLPSTKVQSETDSEGRFEVEGVPVGPFTVNVYSTEHQFVSELTDGADRGSPIDIVLPPMVEFRGRVVDDRGLPVEGAQLWFDRQGFPTGHVGNSATDEHGDWWMFCIGQGQTIKIEVSHEDQYTRSYATAVAPQDELRLVLPRDGALVGELRDPDGRPVPAFELQVIPQFDWDYYERRFRDADLWKRFDGGRGEFRLERLWASASELRVQAEGFVPRTIEVEVAPGVDTELDLVLQPAAAIQGEVVDRGGTPIESASVWIAGKNTSGEAILEGSRFHVRTDEIGAFRLLQGGEELVDLVVRHPDFGVRVFADQRPAEAGRRLVLEPAGSIVGQVHQPWPRGHTSSQVRIVAAGTAAAQTVPVEDGGSFASGPLQPGLYEVELHDEWSLTEMGNPVPIVRNAQVLPGAATAVELDISQGCVVLGVLRTQGSEPSGDHYRVSLWSGSGAGRCEAIDVPDDSGLFRFRGVPPGAFSIRVQSGHPGLLLDLRREIDLDEGTNEVEIEVPAPTLSGRVMDLAGEALDAQVVLVEPLGGGSRSSSTRTDAEGGYQLWTAEDGEERWLSVSAPGHAEELRRVKAGGPALEHRLSVEARLDVELVVARGSEDEGNANGTTWRTAESATVQLVVSSQPSECPPRTRSGSSQVAFTRLPAGRALVRVSAPGFVPVDREVVLAAGQRSRLVVELVPFGRVLVRARTPEGAPVSGLEFRLQGPIADAMFTSRTGARGEVRFSGIPPGPATLWSGDRNRAIEVLPGEDQCVDWVQ